MSFGSSSRRMGYCSAGQFLGLSGQEKEQQNLKLVMDCICMIMAICWLKKAFFRLSSCEKFFSLLYRKNTRCKFYAVCRCMKKF